MKIYNINIHSFLDHLMDKKDAEEVGKLKNILTPICTEKAKELATISPSQLHILGMEAIVLAKLYRSSEITDIPDSGIVKRDNNKKKKGR